MKKRITSLCIAVALFFSMLPQLMLTADAKKADSGKLGENLTWELENGVLTISGAGNMCDFYTLSEDQLDHTTSPWDPYQDEITSVVILPGVTCVGQQAFYCCEKIKEIILPDSVTRVGNWAFANCESLQIINLPDSIISIGECAFLGCDSLSFLDLPDSLTTISKELFSGCSLLTVNLSSSIRFIEETGGLESCNKILVDSQNPYFSNDADGVLYNKDKTELIRVPGSLLEFTIPQGVERIGDYACAYSNLQEVFIPETVTSVGKNAFDSSNLTHISIPGNVGIIEDCAFISCWDLEDVTLSNGVQSIGAAAFCNCWELSEIFIPESVSYIGPQGFNYCHNFNGIWVDENNKYYCNDSYGALYNKEKTELLQAPFWAKSTTYTIPESVCDIGWSFMGYETLTSIVIPPNVSLLREVAFQSTNLNEVYFMGNAPIFEENCFQYLTATIYYPRNNGTWTESIMQNYGGELTWIAADIPNFYGFSLNKDGWTFANTAQSFAEEPASHADDYYIPRERYDEMYGKSYVDSQKKLFTTKWGGNCAGMSATAILFFLESLDWEGIDAEYSEDLLYPNSFYRTVNLHNQSQSYYPAIGNDTEVTRLIEAYQLYINAIDKSRLVENLDNTYFVEGVIEKKTLFGTEYIINHVPNGTYVASMLEEFQAAYEENNPLFIVLQADGFGHGIVARTDLKPEDMGDGWWRVYVYDPNKPYINESVTSTVSGVEAEPKYTFGCNSLIDNGGDIYLELNPSLNQWRYCTSVNSNSSDSYIGSSPSGELLWMNYYHDTTPENKNDDEGKKNNAKMPDFFYTIDLTDLSMEDFANPHFSSTNSWIPENDLAVAVNGDTDCSIYASTGELVAIVEDGDAFVLSDAGSYDAYIGQTEDGGSLGGKIYLPNDVYTVYYTSGAVQFLGSDNVLSFSCDGAAELTVDITLNSLQIIAQEDGIAAVKCANVTSTDECSYVDTEGALTAGETFSIAYSDDNKITASTDSKDGEFQLYQKDANQEEAVALKVVKSSSLWWLWIAGGIGVFLLAVIMWVKRKKQ